jgi:acetyl-CoA carboxylase beta subunit
MIDMVVDRRELKATIARALRFMAPAPALPIPTPEPHAVSM